jgi:hypothetical protein
VASLTLIKWSFVNPVCKQFIQSCFLKTISLPLNEFVPDSGTIHLRNDSDGRGDYIAKWEHPTLARPTDEQLASIE